MLIITTDVDVDFDLDEFDDSEILYELERWIEHKQNRANKLLDLIKEKVPNIQGPVDFDFVYWDNTEIAKDEARKIKNFDKVVEFIKKHF